MAPLTAKPRASNLDGVRDNAVSVNAVGGAGVRALAGVACAVMPRRYSVVLALFAAAAVVVCDAVADSVDVIDDEAVTDTGSRVADHSAYAEESLARALRLRDAGDVTTATRYARAALEIAPPSSDIAARAHDELYFHLPLVEIHRLVAAGRGADAEALVRATLEHNKDDAERTAQLNLVLAQLAHVRGGEQPGQDVDTRELLAEIRGRLRDYRAAHGFFPLTTVELSRVLPPQEAPLGSFDVVRYSGGVEGFFMVLRNRTNEDQVLTLQDTTVTR